MCVDGPTLNDDNIGSTVFDSCLCLLLITYAHKELELPGGCFVVVVQRRFSVANMACPGSNVGLFAKGEPDGTWAAS